jgi:hypothetical protein
MVFQPIRRTAPVVTNKTGELLPHLFTLILTRGHDGYFLLHYYILADIFPLGSMALCVARTFLSDIPITIGSERWNSLLHCKNNINFFTFATSLPNHGELKNIV